MDNKELLHLSWHDSALIPGLSPANIMDYFAERTNPFYDRTCNNEVIKMQRLNPEHLNNLTGLEYILLHCQEPILYVVRKQHRHSAAQVTPLADYYIIAGVVYQAPDLGSIINSRILSSIHHVQQAFEKTQSYSRYHPSKGYWWDFKEQEGADVEKKKEKGADEPGSQFQRYRVDVLLSELTKRYPPKLPPPLPSAAPAADVKPTLAPPAQAEEQQPSAQPSAAAATAAPTSQQANNSQSQPLPKPISEIKQEKPDAVATSTGATTTSAAATTVTSTTTSGSTNQNSNSKSSSTKPPLEKRPRLMA